MKKRDWKNIECRRLIELVKSSPHGTVSPDMTASFYGRSFNSLQSQWNRIKGKTLEDFPVDPLVLQAEKGRAWPTGGVPVQLPTAAPEVVTLLRSYGLRGRVTIELGD